jgi:peptidyl-prolyl cis-trans isomerase B (cyclophilin B)
VILLALVLIIVAGCTKPSNTSPRPTSAPAPTASAAAGKWCRWTTQALPGGPVIKTGTPPLAAPNTGHATMTIKTNRGTIVADVDLSRTPCTAAAFRYLGSSGYFHGTACHRLTSAKTSISILQCGDPSGSGAGGPSFKYADEYGALPLQPTLSPGDPNLSPGDPNLTMHIQCLANLSISLDPEFSPPPGATTEPGTLADGCIEGAPAPGPCPFGTTATTCREVAQETLRQPDEKPVTYARGVLAMANSGPDTNGSQFFIVYKDSQLLPDFTRLGIVTQGLDVVDTVAAGGVQPANGKPRVDGAPKTKLVIESLTVTG